LWNAEGTEMETNEFYRGWCIIEVLVAQYINLIMYYSIDTYYDLKAHQISNTNSSNINYFVALNHNFQSMIKKDASTITYSNYFDVSKKMPEFVKKALQMTSYDEVKDCFDKNGVKCTYHDDMPTVINIWIRYRKKYVGFQVFNPIFLTRCPLDHRSRILNALRNIWEGCTCVLSPVAMDYVKLPLTNFSSEKLEELIRKQMATDEPFYFDYTVHYKPRPLYCCDPDALIAASFDLFDFYGVTYNHGLQIVHERPPDEEWEIVKTFPVRRSPYDYNLGLINPEKLVGMRLHLAITLANVSAKVKRGIPCSIAYRLCPPLVTAGKVYKKARDRGVRSVLKHAFGRPWALRIVVLQMDGTLIYMKEGKEGDTTIQGTATYNGLCSIERLEITDADADGYQNVLRIAHTSKTETLIIRTETSEECDEWVTKISMMLEQKQKLLVEQLAKEILKSSNVNIGEDDEGLDDQIIVYY
jgi:hypothetical protein